MEKNIIAIVGHPYSGHITLAYKLSNNSAVSIVYPYTDCPKTIYEEYNQVTPDVLDDMLESKTILSNTVIDGYRFVFFKEQLKDAYNVLILDDYALADMRGKYDRIYSIKCWSKCQGDSDRVGVYLFNHEFDEVYEYDNDDIDELICRIEDYFMYNHDED